MNYVLPVTQIRKQLLPLIDKVSTDYIRVDITKAGVVKASLISTDYLDELEETIYSLDNSLTDIRRAEAEVKAGKYATLDEYLKKYAGQRSDSPKPRAKKLSQTT